MVRRIGWLLWGWLCMVGWSWGAQPDAVPSKPGVVVVLAGGGAKGFAHLAVLRRLERDHVPVARVVGTSMGAVIGGLYCAGLGIDDIERVIGGLDPAKVALDQIDRLELPLQAREYQRQYPIELEFGLKNGQLSFARGVSDGQRFLALLQQLTAHVPAHVDFDRLRIPFRAVATRYRDGELTVFREGALHMAIRASMAAPGVFAPVEIAGETYVDGGLVANLPVDVALQEGADVIVASYLAQEPVSGQEPPGHALAVANQMLSILIRQNEKRSLALLRPQDVLVRPVLPDVGFTDFRRAPQIVAMGEQAVQGLDARFAQLAQSLRSSPVSPPHPVAQQPVLVRQVRVTGAEHVPQAFVSSAFASQLGRPFSAQAVLDVIDRLYTSGYFERLSWSLQELDDGGHALWVDVNEKTYGPNYFKTSLGFSAEQDGVNQFSVGMGYRRPWLNDAGLELGVDMRAGTQSELALRLHQPWRYGLGLQAHADLRSSLQPVYAPVDQPVLSRRAKLAYTQVSGLAAGMDLVQEFDRSALLRLGWVARQRDYQLDTAGAVSVPLVGGGSYSLPFGDQRLRYTGLRWQWLVDELDSVSFPERGHYLDLQVERGLSGTDFRSYTLSARWAHPFRTHVLNLGLNLGRTDVDPACSVCKAPASLYFGGFQSMGAYRMGQLVGDRLAHVYATYMYRWSDGGLLRQKTFLGFTAEAGDVWYQGREHATLYSGTVFVAVDSKIGDVYVGMARGSAGVTNAFVQLGRRFGW